MSTSYICPPIVVRIPDEDVRVGVPAGLGVMVPVPSGPPGPAGPTGPQGPAGANGVSPVLTVTDIPGGHRITITDATGTKTVDVMDGADAVESVNGQTGVVVLDSTDIDHDNEPISDILGGEQTASGNIVTFTDTTGGNPITALSVEVEPVQNLNGYDNPWPAGGGKNLFEAEVSSSTYAGITATANGDGTFTFNGTATSQFDFYFTDNRQSLANGTYLINGITNGSNSTYRLYAAIYGNTNRYAGLNTGDAEVTLSNETIRLFLRIYNGATLNNVVIKPMIRLATETDSTFAPYSNICPISGWTEAKVTRTGKNILAPGTSRTQQGATYTVNPDGTITVTGTAIASSKCILNSVLLKGGTQYVLSGCPIGGGQGKFGLALYETGTNTILGTDFGSGVTYTPVSDEIIDVGIRYWYGQSPAGTWKPQLEIGSSPTTYEP
ncbi:MAG: hypothetical protein IJH47_04315, partial [Oscillospiraceae bacterium]|nr:hypothetical protein [Oscillospiraceae bacterium]